jgi:hypothetical protein
MGEPFVAYHEMWIRDEVEVIDDHGMATVVLRAVTCLLPDAGVRNAR